MARGLSLFLRENLRFFQSFERIILYYDNGQKQITRMLNSVLATEGGLTSLTEKAVQQALIQIEDQCKSIREIQIRGLQKRCRWRDICRECEEPGEGGIQEWSCKQFKV